jgi:hypothetical protein
MKHLFARAFFPGLLLCQAAMAQQTTHTIFLVRHAETASSAPDSPLSPSGMKRAECLVKTLKDAGIKQIYVSDTKRAQQTAEPLAKALGIKPSIFPARDVINEIRNLAYGTSNGLAVADSDTLAFVILRLQAGKVPDNAGNEYDRLYVVTMQESNATPVVTVHYCASEPGAPAPKATPSKPVKKTSPAKTKKP